MKRKIISVLILSSFLFATNTNMSSSEAKTDFKQQIIQKYEYAKRKTIGFLKEGKAYLSKKSDELMTYAKEELKKSWEEAKRKSKENRAKKQ